MFPPIFLLIYNPNVKQFGSQMKPHILGGFIWIQIVCRWSPTFWGASSGYKLFAKVINGQKITASRLRVSAIEAVRNTVKQRLRDFPNRKGEIWMGIQEICYVIAMTDVRPLYSYMLLRISTVIRSKGNDVQQCNVMECDACQILTQGSYTFKWRKNVIFTFCCLTVLCGFMPFHAF